MNDHGSGISDLLEFVLRHPIAAMEIHSGNGVHASIDLICDASARLVGVPRNYLQALADRDLLPSDVVRELRVLRLVEAPEVTPTN